MGDASPSAADFEAVVVVGKGLRKLDRAGVLTIADGTLTLRKGKGDLIAQAPVAEVAAEAMGMAAGAAARITIAGERYAVEPVQLRRFAGAGLAEAGANLARDIARIKQGREMTQALLGALDAAGGQVAGS
jgi:hypothetical protein